MQVSTFSQVPESVDHRFQTFAGAVLAAAIADAMGWVTEFARGQKDLENKYGRSIIDGFISWEKQTGGRFYPYIDFISAGEYSDDTQLS